MTTEMKQQKILAVIEARGWCNAEIYWSAAKELEANGIIKLDMRYFTGGNRKPVWVGA